MPTDPDTHQRSAITATALHEKVKGAASTIR
jgi:hypothetical protein